MSLHNNLIKSALAGGAAMLMSTGLAAPVWAGSIIMDFTVAPFANVSNTVASNGPATLVLDIEEYNPAYAGLNANLNIQGFQAGADATGFTRITKNASGIGLCTELSSSSNTAVCGNGVSDLPVDSDTNPDEINESVRFTVDLDPAAAPLNFAVRTVTFGGVDNNDDAAMRFQSSLGASIDFDIRDVGSCGTPTTTCTVDIYALVEALAYAANGNSGLDYVAFNNDAIWTLGQDYIFDYLASLSGFEFQAIGAGNDGADPQSPNDDWFIRGATWVTEDGDPLLGNSVPEPATLALLGAGLIGAAHMRRRRA